MRPSPKFLAIATLILAAVIGGYLVYRHFSSQEDSVALSVALSSFKDQGSERLDTKRDSDETKARSPEELLEERPELKALKRLQVGSNADVDFYGKIIDQHGEPVADAQITYSIPYYDVGILPAANRSEGRGSATSDIDGAFKIENAEGMYLTVTEIRKTGYVAESGNRTFIYTRRTTDQVTHQPDPTNPVIFHAWKKGEVARKLLEGEERFNNPANGKAYTIPLPGIEKSIGITFTYHDDQNVTSERRWTARITVDNGGLIESDDTFMYEAPEVGYQSEWEITAKESDRVEKHFYLKVNNGKMYGHLDIVLRAYYGSKERGYIRYHYALNPTGSRNLLPADD